MQPKSGAEYEPISTLERHTEKAVPYFRGGMHDMGVREQSMLYGTAPRYNREKREGMYLGLRDQEPIQTGSAFSQAHAY